MTSALDIRNFTRHSLPGVPFAKIAQAALPGWDISLVFAGEQRAQTLNRTLRNKDYVPNVLSYQSGAKSGEIIICPAVARRQAPDYSLSYPAFVAFLFIHGLLHLKGMEHGTTMEKRERALLAQFVRVSKTHGTTNRNGD